MSSSPEQYYYYLNSTKSEANISKLNIDILAVVFTKLFSSANLEETFSRLNSFQGIHTLKKEDLEMVPGENCSV